VWFMVVSHSEEENRRLIYNFFVIESSFCHDSGEVIHWRVTGSSKSRPRSRDRGSKFFDTMKVWCVKVGYEDYNLYLRREQHSL
jgi:hypothetical protein